MQVNMLSLGLQDALKESTNFNTARSSTLFDNELFPKNDNGEIDFASLNVEDLNITPDQISNLLAGFAQEIVKVFGGDENPKANTNQPVPTNPDGADVPAVTPAQGSSSSGFTA